MPTENIESTPTTLQDIAILSSDTQEFISNKPVWIVRNGITLFLGIIVLLILSAFLISYPDIVISKVKLSSINAPKEVKTKTEGKLIKLLVSEADTVKKGQFLGYIESTADHKQLINFSKTIDSMVDLLNSNETNEAIRLFSRKGNSESYTPYAGEVESGVAAFMQSFNIFRQYLSNGYFLEKANMLRADITYMQKLHDNLMKQKEMQEEDLGIAKETFDANSSLKEDRVISPLDYRNEKSKYIGKALTIPQITAAIISNESSQHDKQKEIAELENNIAQQKGIFMQAINVLKSQLDDWKNKYLLIAPTAGKVAFVNFLQENEQLFANQTICFVNPANSQYFAEATIPQFNFGKVKKGQKILLKLSSYPYQEFGIISGNIDYISSIPTDSGYMARINLPSGLNTNSNKVLQFHEGLTGQGEIITADRKLSDKIFDQLRELGSRD